MKKLILALLSCTFLFISFTSFQENKNVKNRLHAITFSDKKEDLKFPLELDSAEPADSSGGGDQAVPYGVTDIANMFNERGFYKSNGFSFDGNEIINDFNGNLIYNIPLYNYPLAGDLNFDMALTYNGSVGHQFILGTTTEYNNFPQRYNMNAPEWIISVNGIAIQVLNFETNFFTTKSSNPNINYIKDDSVKLLIPGYHFDGSLEAADAGNPNRINILAGDGSVISLVRISTATEADSLYVGNYVYEGKELYYRAKVNYIETGGYTGFRRRKVELMKGDGTVCTFIEHKRAFADLPIDANITARRKPMLLLLQSITDRFGHNINFEYSFSLQTYGRPLLSSVSANGYSQANLGVSFEYGIIEGFQNPTYGVKIEHSSEVNGSYTCYYETPVVVVPVNQNGIRNHRASIKRILNILNQETTIQYDDYRRTFQNMVYYNVSGNTFDITNMKRMIYYKNFLGKGTAYGYGSSDNISVTESGNSKLKSTNHYRGYGRDEFYTNMLYSKTDSNNGVAKSHTTFSYPYTGNFDVDSTDNYTTTKSVSSLESSTLNNSASSISTTRKYKVFPLHNPYNFYLEQPDLQGITKLMSDTTYSSNGSQYNEYYYEKGDMINSGLPGLDGSFLIKSKKNRMQGISRLWTYTYTYQSGSIKPLKSMEETDPFNNKTFTSYINFYEEDFIYKIASNSWSYQVYDKMCFYKIQVDSMQLRKDNSNNVLSKKLFEYVGRHDSTIGYYGQLRKEKVFNNYNFNDFIQTEYEYYRNDTSAAEIYHWDFYPNKNGNLKTITKPNGEQEKYYYHMISVSEIYPGDTINLTDEEPYRRHLIKMKFNNGVVKDTNATMWDTRFPIRIDNYKINGTQVDTLSKIYKTYNIAGYPTRTIDQDLYVTEFKYQPIHRINSITLPGDFSTSPDSTFMRIDTHYIKTSLELITKGWGYYNTVDGKVTFNETSDYYSLKSCDPFKMLINGSNNKYAFIKLDTSNKIYNFTSIDSAMLQFSPISFSAINDGNPISNASFNTQVKGITYLSSYSTWQSCGYNSHNILQSAEIATANTEINLDTINNNCSFCCYRIQRFDVKNLINTFISNHWPLVGLTMHSYYNGIGTPPAGPSFNLNFTNCTTTPNGNHQYWYSLYRPALFVYGNLDISDTLKYPIVKGGTIKYKYDDVNKKIDVLSIRNTLSSDYSNIRYSVDGFGNIMQKDIYYDSENYNSYKYRFNYMNGAARNFEPDNDSTMFSYDGLGRLIKTKNTDTSSTLNSFAYYNSMNTYFGTVSGLIEKQTFRDEQGNDFEKYFDAVGNLIREVKYFDGTPDLDNPNAAITDYRYDSLYRVRKVKTPNTKIITYSYDGFGRQSTRSTPDAGITYFTYDKNNNLLYSQDANQRSIATNIYTFRSYDGLNRLTAIGETTIGAGAVNYDNINIDSTYAYTLELDNPTTNFYLTINAFDTISTSVISIFGGVNGYSGHNFTKGKLAATAYRTRLSDAWNFKYYRYDVRGRVLKMWNVISGFDTLVTDYQYNSQDQITIYSHSRDSEVKTFRNSYDYAGRLTKVEFYVGWPDAPDPTYITLADYSYNESSQIMSQMLNDGGIKNNYYYNNRNWVSEIQESGGLFDFINDYYKNGNIKSQEFSGTYNDNFSNSADLSFDYSYDKSNRLLNTVGLSNKSYDLENTYDKDGNIVTLKRYGSTGTLNDNFAYSYYSGTNKLQKVYGSTSQYTYDANGNMKTDEVNRNRDIKCDYRNLITQIRNKKIVIEDSLVYLTYYYYDEAGNRLRKKVYQYIGIQQPDSVESPDTEDIGDAPGIWELINDEIYSKGVDGRELAIYINGDLKQTNIWGLGVEGYITSSDFPNFYVKDHLGSIRAITDENNTVISAQDYDVWGYLLQARQYESDESVYKFTGKERDEETGYDYFGARYYDPRIGRWGAIDPQYDNSPNLSPYQYANLNSLIYIDPNGLDEFKLIIRTYIPTEYAFNFKGDNRGSEPYATSFRTQHIITIETDPNISSNPIVNDDKGATGLTIGFFPDIEGDPSIVTGKAEGEFSVSAIRGDENLGDNAIITLSGSAADPLVPFGLAPPAQYNFSIQIIPGSDGTIVKILGGGRTEYPSMEIFVEPSGGVRQLIENYPSSERFLAPFDLYNKVYIEYLEKNIK